MSALYGEEIAALEPAEIAARLVLAVVHADLTSPGWYRTPVLEQVSGTGKLVVFSAHTGFLAHTGRALMVAEALRRQGAKVIFIADLDTLPDRAGHATQRRYAELIRKQGFASHHVPSVPEGKIMEYAQRRASWGFYDADQVRAEVESQLATLKRIEAEEDHSPDVLVADFSPALPISGLMAGIPVVSLQNFSWTNNCSMKLALPDVQPVARAIARITGRRFARGVSGATNLTNMLLKYWLLPFWARPFNEVRRASGLPEVRNFYDQTEGDLVLFPDFPGFTGMVVDARHLPIMPLIWEPSTEISRAYASDERLAEFRSFLHREQDGPLIYVTMGSTGELDLFRRVLKALQDAPYRIAITTGSQFEMTALDPLPNNARAVPMYPGAEVLAQASLVITHGGSGSNNQALAHGVPALVLPTHADQQWGGQMLEQEGLGLVLLEGDRDSRSIRSAVESLLSH